MTLHHRDYSLTVSKLPESTVSKIIDDMGLVSVLELTEGNVRLSAIDFYSTGESAVSILDEAESFLREKNYIKGCLTGHQS